jgi:hypothetical protein
MASQSFLADGRRPWIPVVAAQCTRHPKKGDISFPDDLPDVRCWRLLLF